MKLSRENLQKLDKDDLIEIILELVEKLDQQGKQIQALERAAARQAARFSKGKGKTDKKKSGRKKGKGVFTNRKEPKARLSDKVETTQVPLESDKCPECGEVLDVEVEIASTVDIQRWPAKTEPRA